MTAYLLAVLFLALFGLRVRRDRRRFGNGVLLGLAFALLTVGLLGELDRLPTALTRMASGALPVVATVASVVTATILVANGITMIRKEGGQPANLLSLLAGVGVFTLIALVLVAVRAHSRPLHIATAVVLLPVGYLSFLLLCFVGYSLLYGRLTVRRSVDFVVVLGSGLINGSEVPPLLASRLDRGLAVHRSQSARASSPTMVVSGGKGSDERSPESQAMADYLISRGVPLKQIVQEDRSTSTEENLEFSRSLMEQVRPGYRCVIVTNNFHVLRSALTARRAGVRGQVLGAPTAAYYWPSAMLREFAAVILSYRMVNVGMCALLVLLGAADSWRA
ncbi:YdcF family protein [Kitasatospora sp. NBC_01250]|uniref:YdcF family protein n=1 Tax=Kitasatospora sp. NBC_01250 TaxID=2903571 RepID=UPI002E357C20|nr:YdcF family protein [Kitasatospora sp. NBC_01250]